MDVSEVLLRVAVDIRSDSGSFWGVAGGQSRQPPALRHPEPASLGCRFEPWAASSRSFLGGSHVSPDGHQQIVTQTPQFLDFRVCSSLRFSRPSLFGQMIGKRKKTHFWWRKDSWLTGPTSLWLLGILVLLFLSQGRLRPPC